MSQNNEWVVTELVNDPSFHLDVEQLIAEGGYTIIEMANALDVGRGNISSVVAKLKRAGRAELKPSTHTYQLTEKGIRLMGSKVGARRSRISEEGKMIEAESKVNDIEKVITPEQELALLEAFISGYQQGTKEVRDHFLGSGMLSERALRTQLAKMYQNSNARLQDERTAYATKELL